MPTTYSDASAFPGALVLALILFAALVLVPIVAAEILDRRR
jgi:hypothetical protein